MELNQRVKFVKVHCAMNKTVKSYINQEGVIDCIGEGFNKQVLVSFKENPSKIDSSLDKRWWINPKYLQAI